MKKLQIPRNRQPVDKDALSNAEQAKRLGELTVKIDELQRDEEALIQLAAASGATVSRRPNASPGALLGVVTAKREAAAA